MTAKIPVCLLTSFLSVGLALLPATSLVAQDDPFNQPAAARPEQPVPAPAADPATPLPALDATTRAIIQSSPQTPAQILAAVDMLLDLDRDDLAAPFVQQLLDQEIDDPRLFDLYRSAGPDKVIRLGLRAGLGANGSALSEKIVSAAQRFASSDERIGQLLELVISEDTWQRSRALGDLQLLGDAGAAALIELLRDDQYQPYWPRIRTAIEHFEGIAMGPLVAAWNSNSAKLRVEALMALGKIRSNEAIESLLGPAHTDEGSINQVVAARSVGHLMGRQPDRAESELLLYQSARDNLMGYVVGGNDSNDVKWWRWDPESRKLVVSWMDSQTATRIRGYRRARDLVAMNPEREDYQRLYWVTRLESAKLAGGPDLPLPNSVRDELAGQVTFEFVNQVLAEAIELHRIPAAIAACELLGAKGDATLLDSVNGSASPLVQALDVGSVRLTHAACQAIHQLEPEKSFVGCSRYIDSLVFLSRSTGSRFGLVGHVNRETAQQLATRISSAGFGTQPVTSSRELIEQANINPDLQLLVVTDLLGPPGYVELLQTLRINPHTRLVPVLLLVQSDNLGPAQRLAQRFPNVMASTMIFDESLLARQLDNLMTRSIYQDASQSERASFGQSALDQLAVYAGQQDRFAFFDLLRHERELSQLLASPASAMQTCELLGQIGTADAQLNLVNTASDVHLPTPLRQVAAESFAKAVRSRGLMLNRDSIMTQYDRYNASAQESPETRQILGTVLDSIERRTD